MAIPDYQTIMLPLLIIVSDNEEHTKSEAVDKLAKLFKLTDEELEQLLPSGRQRVFDNRVGWARTYLKKAGLLEPTRRSFFKITNRGLNVLKQNPKIIDNNFLKQFPEFMSWLELSLAENKKEKVITADKLTPEEELELSFQEIEASLAEELLAKIKECTPKFFENVVIELLLSMGYGSSRAEAAKAIGQSGDGGIDGIIKEDRLGLDIIYIQAKRWNDNIGRPEIQKFAGALEGKRARKGVFITTADFSNNCYDYVNSIDKKIILINGQRLAKLMIEHSIGISKVKSFSIKKIDNDYFEGD